MSDLMTISTEIRNASPEEADLLSDLALRSKAHWEYPREFVEACRQELTYQPSQIDNNKFDFVVVEENATVIGFYALEKLSRVEFELDALFVEPKYIGKGYGRRLIKHALSSLATKGARKLLIQGDPNAAQFYIAAGGRQIGVRESGSVPSRLLPLFEIIVPAISCSCRLAHTGDLVDLVDLAVRSFIDTYGGENDEYDLDDYLSNSLTVAKLGEELEDINNEFLLVRSDQTDELIGYAKLSNGSCHSSVIGKAAIEIERIYVDNSVMSKGVGSVLMSYCLARAHSLACDVIWLGVWEKNPRAIQFYERWGFLTVGEHKFKLGSNIQNDFIMNKSLAFEDG